MEQTMMRSALPVLAVFIALLTSAATVEVVPKPKRASTLPPGPHLILSVPIDVHSVPLAASEYVVGCSVYAEGAPAAANSREGKVTGGPPAPVLDGTPLRSFGTGTASGEIPADARQQTRDGSVLATVGIFLNENLIHSLDEMQKKVKWYRCELTLRGTAYGVTTVYLSGNESIPLAPQAPYVRVVEGLVPK